jgi:hypothetical protein
LGFGQLRGQRIDAPIDALWVEDILAQFQPAGAQGPGKRRVLP